MENPKVLLTFGSNNSLYDPNNKTWTYYLDQILQLEHSKHFAKPNIGNDVIATDVLYHVKEYLKTYERHELLVGIMWEEIEKLPCYHDDEISRVIANLEYYFMIEMYLKKLNIKYFMTGSHLNTHPSERKGHREHTIIKSLFESIDYTFWLECNSIYMWCLHRRIPVDAVSKLVGEQGQLEFTNKRIMDFLIWKEYIQTK